MTSRLELFVSDLPASQDFYRRILGFEMGEQHADGYTPVTNGDVRLALNHRSTLSDTHPLHISQDERPGLGIEIVFEVDNIDDLYAHVRSQSWPISSPLQQRAWGLTDFRLVDPDGYYLRLTSR
jgi:catechol 2,3-dioxygenase-like lactoylglutathione lyase family enzyme